MTKFKEFLFEQEFSWIKVKSEFHEFLEDIQKEVKKLHNSKLIFRGHGNGRVMGGAMLVTNDRSGFYGNLNPNAAALLKELNVKNPTFGARAKLKTRMFGAVFVIVPKGEFKAYQSKEFPDALASFGTFDDLPKDDIKKIADSYKNTLDEVNEFEIIFDSKEYYLLNIDFILKEIDKGNKFQKFKSETIETYADLEQALKSVISFMKFKKKSK